MSNSVDPTTRGSRGGQWQGDVPDPRPPLSRAQIDSTLARLEGLFGFVFALLSIPVLNDSADTLRPAWAWGISFVLFGSIGVAFVASLAGRAVRVSMGVVACVFVATLVLWPLAVRSSTAAIGTQPWLWYIVIVAIGAAAISFPTFWAAAYTIAVPVIFAVLRVLPAGGGASWELALLDAVYALLLGSFVVMVVTALRSTASQVDEAQSTAVRRYADAAKRHAAEQERTRVDTVIHDRVLSTLLAASRGRSEADRALTVQMARRALVALQSADAESEGSADLPLSVLVARSRSLAATLTAEIAFSAEGELGGTVPARVIEGLYSATVQAIVNSIRHAGEAERSISVQGRAGAGVGTGVTESVSVEISDTGRGFDVDAVSPDRLGLRISIRERVDAVGGAAEIRSEPGAGTTVVLTWPAPKRTEAREAPEVTVAPAAPASPASPEAPAAPATPDRARQPDEGDDDDTTEPDALTDPEGEAPA